MSETEYSKFKSGYVAIVGKPNVGKSTLLNNFLSFKAASVTPKPQTTRHQIRGILNGDGFQIIFLDTPGILEPKYKLQEAMMKAVQRSLEDADLALFLIDVSKRPDDMELEKLQEIPQQLIVVINKIDLVPKSDLLPLIESVSHFKNARAVVPVSALKKDGLENLQDEILKLLPVNPPYYNTEQILDHPERFVVAEIIREKIFEKYGEEIPYSTTVTVEDFKERSRAKDYIGATIYVERASQKGILIGKKGVALKRIGKLSREAIEAVLDRPVFLELWVKVKEKWRKDERSLKDFGYFE